MPAVMLRGADLPVDSTEDVFFFFRRREVLALQGIGRHKWLCTYV